jgi:hypothetical protein
MSRQEQKRIAIVEGLYDVDEWIDEYMIWDDDEDALIDQFGLGTWECERRTAELARNSGGTLRFQMWEKTA